MGVPAEPPLYVVPALMSITSHNVFNGSCQNVAVMRKASGKGRTIVECIPIQVIFLK